MLVEVVIRRLIEEKEHDDYLWELIVKFCKHFSKERVKGEVVELADRH